MEEKSKYLFDFPLLETRHESYEKVNYKLRYRQILTLLFEKPMTAKEISIEMKKRGYSYSDERNISAPRLNELMNMGIVDCIGKIKCEYSGKTVGVYKVILSADKVLEKLKKI